MKKIVIINPEHPIEFIYYLKSNRKIHINALISNIILIVAIIGLFMIFPSIPSSYIIISIIYELISIFINFECINLQNYNLERFQNKDTKEKLIRIEKKQIERDLKNCKNCSKVVASRILNSSNIPSVSEVAEEIRTKKEADELKIMASRRLKKIKEEKRLRRIR